jgi:hypothetical protein
MSDAFSHAGAVILVLVLGAGVLALAYRQSKRRVSTDAQSRSWLDYLLLWPLLFDKSSSVDRSRRLLTNREIMGWFIVVLLMIIAVVFF